MRRMIDVDIFQQDITQGYTKTKTIYFGKQSNNGYVENNDKAYEKIIIKRAEISERAEIGPDIQTDAYAYVDLTITNNGFSSKCLAFFSIIDEATLAYYNKNKPSLLYFNIYDANNNPYGITNTVIFIGNNKYVWNQDNEAYILQGTFVAKTGLDDCYINVADTNKICTLYFA